MGDVITEFLEKKVELIKYLNIDAQCDISFHLDAKWSDEGGDITYYEDDVEYGFEVRGVDKSVTEKHSTFLVDDGCGNTFYAVFKNSNKGIEEYES